MSALKPLQVCLLQTATHWHDPERNRAHFAGLIDEINADVDLVVLPEMFSTGFTMASSEVAEPMSGPTVRWLAEQAERVHAVVCGSVVIADGDQYYNRLVWMRPDGEFTTYDKRHCFRMADEHLYYSPGRDRVIVTLQGWRICLSICYDLRFPVWLRNQGDYDVLLCVANWPAARRDAWTTLLRARAIENQAYVVGVNIVGVDGNNVSYAGGSGVYTADGQVLGEYLDEAAQACITLDHGQLVQLRRDFPVWQDADTFRLTSEE